MIVQTKFKLEEDGWTLVRTISDRGMMIQQDGTDELFAEAIDPDFTARTYTETDIPVESDMEPITDESATATDYINALVQLGVEI